MKKTLAALAAVTAVMALNACSTTPEAEAPAGSTVPSQSSSSAAPSSAAPSSAAPSATTETTGDTAVTITAGDQTFEATINDSQVSQDFLATLSATLSWERNAGIEYIAALDEPMTETGPFYTDVEAGDIVYYNPADSITIIYAPTSSVPTLTKMGEVTSDLAAFREPARQRRDAHRAPVAARPPRTKDP